MLLHSTTTTALTSAGPFLVPQGVNFTINATAGQVKYDKVEYDNINGMVLMNDEKVKLQNVKTEGIGWNHFDQWLLLYQNQ